MLIICDQQHYVLKYIDRERERERERVVVSKSEFRFRFLSPFSLALLLPSGVMLLLMEVSLKEDTLLEDLVDLLPKVTLLEDPVDLLWEDTFRLLLTDMMDKDKGKD